MVVIILSVVQINRYFNTKPEKTTVTNKRQLSIPQTAKEIVEDMKLGWNLGNTLEAFDGQNKQTEASYYETLYQNPVTTNQMITTVKEAGFNAIRIPVAWHDHIYYIDETGNKIKQIDINNLTVEQIKNIKIEQDWLARVKEIVNYAKDNEMYVILSIHHDMNSWISVNSDSSQRQKYEAVLAMLWKQIAEEFKDYNHQLLFEGYNELMPEENTISNETTAVTNNYFETANRLNQKFVDTVRNTGGNNKTRFLVLNTYDAKVSEEVIANFIFPEDTIENHLILSAHLYDELGEYQSEANNDLYESLKRLSDKANDKNAGLIIGEFGTNTGLIGEETAAIANNYYVRTAKSLGITCFYWDEGTSTNATINLLDRNTLTWLYPKVVEGLVKGAEQQDLSTNEIGLLSDRSSTIKGISIATKPTKTIYKKGEKLDLTGGMLKVSYSDGSATIIPLTTTGIKVVGYNSNRIGNQILTVTYQGKITILEVEVKNTVQNIEIKQPPTKTTYIKGEPLDLTGGILTVTYADNTITNIPMTSNEIKVSGYNSDKTGTQTVTITYEEKSTTLKVIVKNDVERIEIKKKPSKTTYIKGENLDLTDGILTVYYEDKTTANIPLTSNEIEVKGYDANSLGRQTITVTYQGQKTTFEITVKNEIIQIVMKEKPSKTTYIRGENLDLTDGIITVYYEDTTTTEIPLTSDEISISGYDNKIIGMQTITVTYRGKQTTFEVTVKNDVEKIEIKTKPSKTVYIKGETLDLTEGEITAYYEDKTTATIPMTSEEVQITGYNTNRLGTQTIFVRYQGKQTTFEVTVKNDVEKIEIKTQPLKTVYIKGETLDLTEGKITVYYEDKTTATILMTSEKVQVTNYDANSLGRQTLTVTYQEKQTTFEVIVKNDVEKIEIKTKPSKTTYIKGEDLDLTNGIITAYYEDNTTENIPMTSKELQISGFDSNTLGTKIVTIIYQGKTASFNVIVKNDLEKIEIKTKPSKITYIKGEALDLTEGTIIAYYEDNTTATIPMTSKELQISGYESNTLGTKTITITYQGKTVSFNVSVKNDITGIVIKNGITKTTYIKGEAIDLSGGVITVLYEDGSSANIPMTSSKLQITGYDRNKIGNQMLTITYHNQIAILSITVKNEVSAISVKENITKRTYTKGEDLDLSGGILTVTYQDGTTSSIPMTSSNLQITGYDSTKTGNQTITVTYQGKQTTFQITIEENVAEISIKNNPLKTIYLKGEDLDLTDGAITVVYSNGTTSSIPMTSKELQITGYDNTQAGIQTLTITYQGKQTTFQVTVKQEIKKITIKTSPNKTKYKTNEPLDLTGGVITVLYEDDTTSDILMSSKEVKVTGYNNTKPGTQKVTIIYEEQEASFEVTVEEEKNNMLLIIGGTASTIAVGGGAISLGITLRKKRLKNLPNK